MYSLAKFTDLTSADLVFLSEPQMFTSDLPICMAPFRGEYSWELNSEEKLDENLAMLKTKAKGGTLVLWKKNLDKYISVYHVNSPSFLPIIYSPPGSPVSVHISLYLPTSGREEEFIEALAELSNTVEDITDRYENCLIFLRGDGNVNSNNTERMVIFSRFISSFRLVQVPLDHKTYHHFLGGGAFDSNIDIILHTDNSPFKECITTIFCKLDYPEIDSHHDIILSSITIPLFDQPPTLDNLVTAPRIGYKRHKILWSDEGISDYQNLVSEKLSQIRTRWLDPLSRTSLSVLLSSTNDILSRSAIITNKPIDLSESVQLKSEKKPFEVKQSEALLKKVHRNLDKSAQQSDCTLKSVRNKHRSLVRAIRTKKEQKQDEKLFTILSSNPAPAFRAIKSSKSSSQVQVPYITVDNKKYVGDKVIDGFYESISNLKSLNSEQLHSSPYHSSMMEDYQNIKSLCTRKVSLPQLSLEKSTSILKRIKSSVNDIYSITANHYIFAGTAGYIHYNLLLNAFIMDVNNCTVEELNTVYALLLYKGHKKDRTLDSSYRTISTCPLIAKGLDVYVRDLSIDSWNDKQAETQYQGEGSNHELASLLITEAIQHSIFSTKQPIFLLFLDAKSAFEAVIIAYLTRSLYLTGMNQQAVLYMDNRLKSRLTVLEFGKVMVGPIDDEQGLEQGGVSSSDCYKLYNNELLKLVQNSRLGVDMGSSLVLSGVGQADDTVLLSNDIRKLNHILQLCLNYCQKYQVQLNTSKTKLLMISPQRIDNFVPYNPINLKGEAIKFCTEAEHVGVIRAESGNLPNIVNRVSAFKRALGAITSCGLARGRRSNPSASIHILSIYGSPVLMSGLASLVLSSKEIASIDQQMKRTVQNIIKLSTNSPPSLVCFISGTLPCTAILHVKQLTLFGMVCRLQSDPLHHHAKNVLLTYSSPKSWFLQVRDLLLQYHLPHPLLLLQDPPTKESFKKQIKAKVLDFWERKLRAEAAFLPSLTYFHPQFMSLTTTHKVWTTAGQNTHEVAKARIQLLFLSSQYPCSKLLRHWSSDNPLGLCTFPTCQQANIVESPEHILLCCPAYSQTRHKLIALCLKHRDPVSHLLVTHILLSNSQKKVMQFLLDSSAVPEVIRAAQINGDQVFDNLFYLSRTWCFSLHRERMKRLCKWNFC